MGIAGVSDRTSVVDGHFWSNLSEIIPKITHAIEAPSVNPCHLHPLHLHTTITIFYTAKENSRAMEITRPGE